MNGNSRFKILLLKVDGAENRPEFKLNPSGSGN